MKMTVAPAKAGAHPVGMLRHSLPERASTPLIRTAIGRIRPIRLIRRILPILPILPNAPRSATLGNVSTAYQTNPLNQYTVIDTDAPQYDNDGNMTQYDGMNLTYNGENRLVAVEPQLLVTGAQRFAFVYDYMGRRVQMTVSTYGNIVT